MPFGLISLPKVNKIIFPQSHVARHQIINSKCHGQGRPKHSANSPSVRSVGGGVVDVFRRGSPRPPKARVQYSRIDCTPLRTVLALDHIVVYTGQKNAHFVQEETRCKATSVFMCVYMPDGYLSEMDGTNNQFYLPKSNKHRALLPFLPWSLCFPSVKGSHWWVVGLGCASQYWAVCDMWSRQASLSLGHIFSSASMEQDHWGLYETVLLLHSSDM